MPISLKACMKDKSGTYLQVSSQKNWKDQKFLEGFMNDLLKSMRLSAFGQSWDGDDLVCLLHADDAYSGQLHVEKNKLIKKCPLFLKSRVSRWFQRTMSDAWSQISHKYEFDLIYDPPAEFVACWLGHLLVFIESSLNKKCLYHVLIGNALPQIVVAR
ncbi:LOW QUALITY PROTEIN: uncharacterized protein LOC133476869 [Phyllopteryx taeniolatus]|uniref:LOW QUALITY PROTEIN: uncharacterized protein LOC133476869 n=1 Tax=Phyllopteryx taeniolatus TaxID=161469 RepID=UPI002AD59107|nr:LOW QUALITY PROTEIN: uncharacterized protein LOC133476869 [Phyllopteryx taeniolatus]